METGEVDARFRDQGGKARDGRSCASLRPRHTVHPVHKIQRLEDDVRGAVLIGGLQCIAHPPIPGQRQAPFRDGGPGHVAADPLQLAALVGLCRHPRMEGKAAGFGHLAEAVIAMDGMYVGFAGAKTDRLPLSATRSAG